MKPRQLLLRCMAQQRDNQWQAFCLDFDLAAQADTLDEAKRKLELQVEEYVYDALAGEDRQYADQLLTRRAPLSLWAQYYGFGLLKKFVEVRSNRRFKEPIPLVPQHCAA